MTDKPHHSRIDGWYEHPAQGGLGYRVNGMFMDHPQLKGYNAHTSFVVARNGNEIETNNSRYTLLNPRAPEDQSQKKTGPLDIMLDLETLDVGPFPALLSIGAVAFDPYGTDVVDSVEPPMISRDVPMTPAEYRHAWPAYFSQVSPESCMKLGATMSDDTLRWWFAPDQAAARQHVMKPGALHIVDAMVSLITWLHCHTTKGSCLWTHGLMADARWIDAYVERQGERHMWPFGYRDTRDTRTLYTMADQYIAQHGYAKPEFIKPTIPHHPTYDAVAQARNVQQAYRTLGLRRDG